MGYTHYWDAVRFTTTQFDTLKDLVSRMQDNCTTPIRVKFKFLDDGNEQIWIYGECEEFVLNKRYFEIRKYGDFCKTRRMPYDELVVATLIAASEINPNFKWGSDGNANDHIRGRRLHHVTTMTMNEKYIRFIANRKLALDKR